MVTENCVFKEIWSMIQIILLMYVVILTPYNISFIDNSELYFWINLFYYTDYIVESIFLMDIFVNLNTVYRDDNDHIIVDRFIIHNYATNLKLTSQI